MTTALMGHQLLTRRRRTRTGWIDIIETVLEEAEAKAPEIIDGWDGSWPTTSPSPRYSTGWLHVRFSDEPGYRSQLLFSDPNPRPAWWDNGWPRRSAPDRSPAVWQQMELGTRVASALLPRTSYRTPDCQWCEEGVMCPGRCPWIRNETKEAAAA